MEESTVSKHSLSNFALLLRHHQMGIVENEIYTCVITVAIPEPVGTFKWVTNMSSNSESPLQATPHFLGGLGLSPPRLYLWFGLTDHPSLQGIN